MAHLLITTDTLKQIKSNLEIMLQEERAMINYYYEHRIIDRALDRRLEREEQFDVMIVNINNSLKEINNLPRDTSLDESNM